MSDGVRTVLRVCGGLVGVVAFLSGCAGPSLADAEPNGDASDLSLEAAVRRAERPGEVAGALTDDLRAYIDGQDPLTKARAAIDPEIESLDTGDADVTPTPGVYEEPAKVFEAPNEEVTEEPESPDDQTAIAPGGETNDQSAPSAEPPAEKLARQVAELRSTILEMRASGDDAGAAALELVALSMLERGGSGGAGDLSAVSSDLAPAHRRTLETIRALLKDLQSGNNGLTSLDAQRVASVLREHADKLNEQRPLKVARAALCTGVDGYGKFREFPGNTFLAGRAQTVIVYVEVENFGQRAAGPERPDGLKVSPPNEREREKKRADEKAGTKGKSKTPAAPPIDESVIELTESIAIHTEADDLVVWRADDATIRDSARARRDDYYLVQRITLPARLTLGKYSIKVSVRDAATGSTDEAVIPIEIVADAGLAKATLGR